MKIIDILFIIYLLLVLVSVYLIVSIKETEDEEVEEYLIPGISLYIVSTILIYTINHLIFNIFNVNYINSNDYTLKRIINILITLSPILIIVNIIIKLANDKENFNNIKTSLMQKIFTRLNNFIKK
jgi:hypothetical protein